MITAQSTGGSCITAEVTRLVEIAAQASHTVTVQYEDSTQDLTAYAAVVAGKVVVWTHADGTGCDDLDAEYLDESDLTDEVTLATIAAEYADEIATGLGVVVA